MRVPGYAVAYPKADGNFEVANHPPPTPPWLVGLLTALVLAVLMYALVSIAPLALLSWANRPALWQATEAARVPVVSGFVVFVLSKILLPVLVRQPKVLDAWVRTHSTSLKEGFEASTASATDQRSPYSPLPFATDGGQREVPSPDVMNRLSRSDRNCIQIVAQGGAGKTRMALRICEWAFEGAIWAHPTAAVFIDQEFDDLLAIVAKKVNAATSNEPVLIEFVQALLKQGRLLVVVDRLSERDEKTQRAFAEIYERVSPKVLICTARHPIPVEHQQPQILRPLPLDQSTLLSFLGDQLQAEGATNLYPTLRAQGGLVQHLAKLLTLDGRELPVTPLLIRMFVSEVVASGLGSQSDGADALSENVPEAYFRYVARLDATQSMPKSNAKVLASLAIRAATLTAYVELGDDFRPKAVARANVATVLAADAELIKSGVDYLDRMVKSGLLAEQIIGGELLISFVLDPMAECLAAYEQARRCASDPQRWRELVHRAIGLKKGEDGFMLALRMNHAAFSQRLNFPPMEIEGLG